MKAYTDLQQSRKLAKILPIESADMCYRSVVSNLKGTYTYQPYCFECTLKSDIPCWSLAALLSVFSTPRLMLDEQEDGERGWFVSHYTDDYRYDSYYRDEPIDACYDLILQLKEKNLL